jgi:dGTPase
MNPLQDTSNTPPLSPRQAWESQEHIWLSPWATSSTGPLAVRARPEADCPIRTAFQRDRDRILHSKAFRRLKHKTQVFIAPHYVPYGDHYRTRMTHTLEVAQLSRTVARALKLNEDLTEAIALGHDVGHPPFGHLGEAVLDTLSPAGFTHTNFGLRLVTVIEDLNLTQATLDGLAQQASGPLPTLPEAQVVELCDRLAYLHHDVEDAQRADLIQESDVPDVIRDVLGASRGDRLNSMVLDLVGHTLSRFGATQAPAEPYKIQLSPPYEQAMFALRRWMHTHVYGRISRGGTLTQPPSNRLLNPQPGHTRTPIPFDEASVRRVLEGLYQFLTDHPEGLPPTASPETALSQRVVGYIAGMTDSFALQQYETHLQAHEQLDLFQWGG